MLKQTIIKLRSFPQKGEAQYRTNFETTTAILGKGSEFCWWWGRCCTRMVNLCNYTVYNLPNIWINDEIYPPVGANIISPLKAHLKMSFLLPRWDILVSFRMGYFLTKLQSNKKSCHAVKRFLALKWTFRTTLYRTWTNKHMWSTFGHIEVIPHETYNVCRPA